MNNLIKQWYYPSTAGDTYNKKRDYYLDNVKFILINLVVIAHFAMKLTYVDEIKYLMYFIYIFHMPCFIFVNGYLAKRMNSGGKLRADKIMIVFWMYLLFKVGNVLLGYLFGHNVKLGLFKDSNAPWYLLALCIWYLSIPLLERIKTYYLIAGSILFGLAAGYISSINNIMSLSRVFVFFPFFIIGFCLPEAKLKAFLGKRLRLPAFIIITVVFTGIVLFYEQLKPVINIIYGASPYRDSLGELAAYGFIVRVVWYLLAVIMSTAFMLFIPRCKLFFSVLGERTMQVYMTHIWVRNTLVYIGFFTYIKSSPRYMTLLVLPGCIVLTFLLSNRWLKKLYDLLMTPKLFRIVLKKD